jgi:hypothetical protein
MRSATRRRPAACSTESAGRPGDHSRRRDGGCEPCDVVRIRGDHQGAAAAASADSHDVRAGEIGRPYASPVQHRADLAGEHEVGVDNRDGRTLTASRAVARQCRLDAAGPGRTTAGLRAHDCWHQHVTTAVEGLAQQRTERAGGAGSVRAIGRPGAGIGR